MRAAARLILAASVSLLAFTAAAAPGAFSITTVGQTCTNGAPGTFITWSPSSNAISYTVYRDSVAVHTTTSLRFDDFNVVSGTTYSYFVRATDGSSTTDTNPQPDTAPSCTAPGAFTLTATPTCAVINGVHRPVVLLTWTSSSNFNWYDVFRDGAAFASQLPPNMTSIYDTSPDVGNPHSYFVRASGIGGQTNTNTVSSSAPPSTCPAPPTAPTLSGSGVCDSSTTPKRPLVNLNWTASTGATSYDVLRNNSVIQTTTSTAFSDSGVTAGNSYNYVVRANNSGGSADSNQLTINLAADICGLPPGPFTIAANANCNGGTAKVTVTWSASSNAASYIVYRLGTPISSSLPAGTLSFDDTNVSSSTPYDYVVRATNDTGTTQSSNDVAVNVPSNICETSGPPSAASLTGFVECTGAMPKVRLSWSGAGTATSFTVFRDGSSIASGLTSKTYDDTNVASGQSHTYFVRAFNAAGSSDSTPFSVQSIACGNPPPAPILAASLTCNSNNSPVVHLTWNSVAGATAYNILRDNNSFGTTLSAQTLSFDDATVSDGQTHTYQVRASNSGGSADSNAVAITAVACPTSPSLSASAACTNGSPVVHLTWTSSAGSPSYSVRRNGTSIATTSATSYDDATVSSGQSYSYVIRAQNAAGTADSNTATLSVSSTLCATPHPDLAVVGVGLGTTNAQPGDTIVVSFSISNVGNAPSAASVTRIRIGDVVAASVVTPPIAIGTTTPFSQPIGIPSLPTGSYFVFVTSDDDHTTGDVNPTNDTGRSPSLQITNNGTCTLSCASTAPAKAGVLQPVGFALTQVVCPGATITWHFGDGDTASSQSPFHTFQHPGTYSWSVTVASGEGSCQHTGVIEITPVPSRRRGVRH